ncbi:hypothetical protein [Nonomuraea sp. NPDC046570]|uniref:hypothetical protein n=1 Tax=Nonomuraea sp. NPDC046570 TaxID=3155255 RepID=UPI00340F9498
MTSATEWPPGTIAHAGLAYDYVYLAGEYVAGPAGDTPAMRSAQTAIAYALLAIHHELATPWWRRMFRLRTRSPKVFQPAPEREPDADPWEVR